MEIIIIEDCQSNSLEPSKLNNEKFEFLPLLPITFQLKIAQNMSTKSLINCAKSSKFLYTLAINIEGKHNEVSSCVVIKYKQNRGFKFGVAPWSNKNDSPMLKKAIYFRKADLRAFREIVKTFNFKCIYLDGSFNVEKEETFPYSLDKLEYIQNTYDKVFKKKLCADLLYLHSMPLLGGFLKKFTFKNLRIRNEAIEKFDYELPIILAEIESDGRAEFTLKSFDEFVLFSGFDSVVFNFANYYDRSATVERLAEFLAFLNHQELSGISTKEIRIILLKDLNFVEEVAAGLHFLKLILTTKELRIMGHNGDAFYYSEQGDTKKMTIMYYKHSNVIRINLFENKEDLENYAVELCIRNL